MEEIAQRFKEEFSELLSSYKEHLSNTRIISILQSVTRKQIGFKDNPGLIENRGETKFKKMMSGEFK